MSLLRLSNFSVVGDTPLGMPLSIGMISRMLWLDKTDKSLGNFMFYPIHYTIARGNPCCVMFDWLHDLHEKH